ncbi:VOC family protein [Ilumatobacter sp.]
MAERRRRHRGRPLDEEGGWWMVMNDPEGNEFCVT